MNAQTSPLSRFTRITGTGSFLPPKRLTNQDLAAQLAAAGVETSDDWIVARTGIKARHFAEADVPCSDLAVQAARHACQFIQHEARTLHAAHECPPARMAIFQP